MNILSLFDGISCGRVALERAGIQVDKYYASEIDKYAIEVAQKNYPDTIHLGDVNGFESWNLPRIDILIGGSPCQDLSIAKQDRKGLDGERSGLFWKYVDCLKKFKPKYFLLENVASMPKEAKEIITKILGVEPVLINSALVSAQQRKRLYWTNIPNITQPKDKHIYLKDVLLSGTPCDVKNKGYEISKLCIDKSQSLLARDYKGFGNQTMSGVLEPIRIGKIGKGGQGERIYSVKGKSVSLNANGGGRGAKTGLYKVDLPDGDYIIRKLHPIECERLQTLTDNYTEGISNTQRYKCLGNGWTVDVLAHIFSFLKK
jgi:DNA (cytosine-5)-methyltransferase 3A